MMPDSPDQTRFPAGSKALAEVHALFVDRIVVIWSVAALVAVPMSVLRALATGWKPLFSVQILLGIALICVALFRGRLSVSFKKAFICTGLFVAGTGSLFTFGILAGGPLFLIFFNISVALFYTARAFLFSGLASLAVFAVAAWGFVSGSLALPAAPSLYGLTVFSWLSLLFGSLPITLGFVYAFSAFSAKIDSLITELQRDRDLIADLADHDHLTGLPVQRIARDRLGSAISRAKRYGRMVAVLFVDLDGFKAINDGYGHDMGDKCLKAVARRMAGVTRAEDTCSRIGGDEFMVILVDLQDENAALATSKKILEALTMPYFLEGRELALGASIGVALYPLHGADLDGLKGEADKAMYQAKLAGKGRVILAASNADRPPQDRQGFPQHDIDQRAP